MGCHSLLQGIFPAQGSNPGLSHCRQILHCLSYQTTRVPPELQRIQYYSLLKQAFWKKKIQGYSGVGRLIMFILWVPPTWGTKTHLPRLRYWHFFCCSQSFRKMIPNFILFMLTFWWSHSHLIYTIYNADDSHIFASRPILSAHFRLSHWHLTVYWTSLLESCYGLTHPPPKWFVGTLNPSTSGCDLVLK